MESLIYARLVLTCQAWQAVSRAKHFPSFLTHIIILSVIYVSLKCRWRYRSALKNLQLKNSLWIRRNTFFFVVFWQILSYLDSSLPNKHGHQLKVSPQGKIEKHSFSCTSVNTFIFLADALFENEIKNECVIVRNCGTLTWNEPTSSYLIDLSYWWSVTDFVVIILLWRWKNSCMTQTVNLVCHCNLPKYLWQHAYTVIFCGFATFIVFKKILEEKYMHVYMFPILCWSGWDLVWPLLIAQQEYSETKAKVVSKSNL